MPVRIAILGGPRCGKTTLIQQLYVDLKIRDINVGVATEYSTDYLRDKGMIESISEQYGIYLGQLHLEKSLDSHDYAITDYATFVPYIYGRLMLGDKTRTKKEIEILNDLYSLAIRDLPQYDHIFFVPREFGYKKDGVRWQDEEVAQMVDKAILGFLDAENVKYSVITGSTKERSEQIMKTGRLIPATQSNVNKHRIIQEGKTALPKVYMGWTNNFKYKAFDLSFMFYLSLGSYTFNYHRYTKSFVGDGRNNVTADIYENSWKKPGDIAEYPQLRWQDKYNYDDNGNDKQNVTYIKHDAGHTKYLEKSAYLRLRNLTLGYTLPQRICSKINIDALRVYVSAVNLFTITSFNGYDPEVRVKNQTGANAQGAVFSGSEMPQTRIFSAGINFKF